MNRYQCLMQRIERGERILIDGATGTEVERRGVPQLDNAWNGGGAMSHPDVLREIHEDYIRHGAEIVISNTFATSRHALRDAGVEDKFEFLNRRGVELAIEARERLNNPDVLAAGGISYWSWTEDHPPLDDLRSSVEEQAAIMANAGADLLMLEMMVGLERMTVTLEAAQTSGLPVWVGLTCKPNADGDIILWDGDLLPDVLDVVKEKNAPLVSIMHTEIDYIDACLDVLQQHWSGPIGLYPHTSTYDDGKWVFSGVISSDDFVTHSKRWLSRGVQVIGGCCGIHPEHIEALSASM